MQFKNSLEIIPYISITEDISTELENQNIDGSDIECIVVFNEEDLKMYKDLKLKNTFSDYFLAKCVEENYGSLFTLLKSPFNDLELFIFLKEQQELLIGIIYH